jgi:hypothetical protein
VRFAPLVAAAGFYVAFIARTRVSLEGKAGWVLADDPMISMTFARRLAEGNGLTWSNGHRVEGYSDLLWTLFMALVHLLPISDRKTSLVVMAASAVLLVMTTIVVGRICALLAPDRPAVRVIGMVLTGLFYPIAYWALRGNEVGLAAFLVASIALLSMRLTDGFDRRRAVLLAAACSAAVLTRDDLLVPCVIAVGFLVWALPPPSRRRIALYVGGAIVATIAAHEAFRLAYYHDALPNTYYLKLAHVPLGTRFARGAESLGFTWVETLYAPLVMAVAYVVARRRELPRGAILVGALFLGQCAYSLYVGGDFSEDLRFANRYVAVGAPMLIVLAALGVGEVVATSSRTLRLGVVGGLLAAAAALVFHPIPTGRLAFDPQHADGYGVAVALALAVALLLLRGRGRAAAAVSVIAVGLLVTLAVDVNPGRYWARVNAQSLFFDAGTARYGLVLNRLTPPGTRIAMSAAGATAYFSRRPGVDLLGKVDKVIARSNNRAIEFRPGHSKWNYAYSLGRLRPEVVAELFVATPRELCDIARWGYRQVAPNFYVRRGVPGIDPAVLGAAISRTGFWRIPQPAPPRGCVP